MSIAPKSAAGKKPGSETTAQKYAKVNLDQVRDIRIFTEQLLDDYRSQNARLSELEVIVQQLIKESSHERSDERRVSLLKMQNLQLERQLQVMYDGVKQRTGLVSDACSTIDRSVDDLRTYVSHDIGSTEVSVPRRVLISSVEKLNGAKSQLSQSCHVIDSRSLGKPILFDFQSGVFKESGNSGIKAFGKSEGALSLLDLTVTLSVQEKMDLVNISEVESSLSHLTNCLSDLKQAISTLTKPVSMFQTSALDCIAVPLNKLDAQMATCLQSLQNVSTQLLILAFLFPQLTKNKSKSRGLTLGESNSLSPDSVYKAFAPYLKASNVAGISEVIRALIDSMQLQINVAKMSEKSAQNECKFYSSVSELQVKYQTDLFELIQMAFEKFNKDLKRELCDPLADVLTYYDRLVQTPTDENLKQFMTVFKQHAGMITRANYAVLRNDDKGQSGISEFGSGFKDSVEKLRKKRMTKLKEELLALEDVENDFKRFLIYDQHFDKDEISQKETSRSLSGKSKLLSSGRSSSVGFTSSHGDLASERLNPKEPLPQISPTHQPKDHRLPIVRSKKKKPPKASPQYPLPDMEF